MSRAGFWLRWSWRDLRQRWLSVGAIALVIAIGTGLYSGLGSMEQWRKRSNDASFSLLHAHDLKATLTDGDFAEQGALRRVARSIADANTVARTQERLAVPTQIDASTRQATTLTAGRLVGTDIGAPGAPIDGVSVEDGRGLRSADNGRPVAVLEASYADYHELPPTGEIRLAGGRTIDYVGTGRSPEYFLVTRQGGGEFGGAEASFGVLFTSLASAQRIAGVGDSVNELVLTLKPDADSGVVASQLRRALSEHGLGAEVTAFADEPAYRVLYEDAEGDQRVFNVFAYLILAGAAFAAFNLASRIVEAQRREIGIGMALGAPPAELAVRPLLLGLEIAVLGVVMGTAFGLWMSDLFGGLLENLLPLPVIETGLEPQVFLRGAMLGLLLPIAATAVPVFRAVRMPPIEAIRIGFRSAKGGGLVSLLRRVHVPGRSLGQMPIRNVLRAPRRSLMAVLGIAAVVTVVVALLGQIDSFLGTIDDAENEVAGTTPSRVNVSLDRFHPVGSRLVRRVASDPAVGQAEPRLVVPGQLRTGARRVDVSLELLDPRSPIWHPTIEQGSFEPGAPGLVISREAAHDLGVGAGDEIGLVHPQRGGGGAFGLAQDTVRVAGVHPNPFRVFAYMDESQATSMGLEGVVNSIVATPAAGATTQDVERALFPLRGVASVEGATDFSQAIDRRMDDFVGVLRLTEAFALALALLIAFNSSSISADERRREYATMFAYGVPLRQALRIAIVESLVVGAVGTLIGIGLGLIVVGWVLATILPDTVPELGVTVTITGGSVLAAAVVGVAAVALAPLLTARRLRRMDVPSTLRVVE